MTKSLLHDRAALAGLPETGPSGLQPMIGLSPRTTGPDPASTGSPMIGLPLQGCPKQDRDAAARPCAQVILRNKATDPPGQAARKDTN